MEFFTTGKLENKINYFSRWWLTIDRSMLLLVILVACIGMILLMAASPAIAARKSLPSFHFVKNQIIFLASGAMLIVAFSMMNHVLLRRIAALGFVICIILMIYIKLFGVEINGSKRWIQLPISSLALQPSEFIKPFFAVLTAWILTRSKIKPDFPSYKISLLILVITGGLLALQPDIGMTVCIAAIWGGQIFLAGLPIIWIIVLALSGIGGIIGAYFTLSHVKERIDLFLKPESGDNFQSEKSLEAFINGGLLGKGPGEGEVKTIIPDSHTDFIFAVAGEELGLIVCMVIVALYGFIVIRGLMKILNENDLFVILAASGLLIQFGFQAFVNMGVALSILPNKGMTLPFISYGGSSVWGISIGIGMFLAFTRKRFGRVY